MSLYLLFVLRVYLFHSYFQIEVYGNLVYGKLYFWATYIAKYNKRYAYFPRILFKFVIESLHSVRIQPLHFLLYKIEKGPNGRRSLTEEGNTDNLSMTGHWSTGIISRKEAVHEAGYSDVTNRKKEA